MFSSYVTKGKIKNNFWKNIHHERSPKNKMERQDKSKINEVEEKSFEKLERENEELRREV